MADAARNAPRMSSEDDGDAEEDDDSTGVIDEVEAGNVIELTATEEDRLFDIDGIVDLDTSEEVALRKGALVVASAVLPGATIPLPEAVFTGATMPVPVSAAVRVVVAVVVAVVVTVCVVVVVVPLMTVTPTDKDTPTEMPGTA